MVFAADLYRGRNKWPASASLTIITADGPHLKPVEVDKPEGGKTRWLSRSCRNPWYDPVASKGSQLSMKVKPYCETSDQKGQDDQAVCPRFSAQNDSPIYWGRNRGVLLYIIWDMTSRHIVKLGVYISSVYDDLSDALCHAGPQSCGGQVTFCCTLRYRANGTSRLPVHCLQVLVY